MLILLTVGPAHADVMYSYVGDTFKSVSGAYTTAMRIEGYFVVPNLLTFESGSGQRSDILTYSFSDGRQTLTQANSASLFILGWDSDHVPGQFTEWGIRLTSAVGTISTDGSHYTWSSPEGGDHAAFGSDTADLGFGYVLPPSVKGASGVWSFETVSVPELATLPRLPRVLKFGLGLGLEARITTTLQRATAWLAAAILRAPRDGVTIRMPRVSVEVAEACSGLQTLGLLLSVGALIGAVLPARRLPWALALVVAAVVLALEANALRVAGIAIGLEYVGPLSLATKDWIGAGTTGLALVQMAVLGRLVGLGRLPAR
ncbi:MAG TPA: archaeosortase/exosortase family protein [Candidatus Binatia bacterium]|nr:archaeosortase/exosortase family protein [Candidatus Binatia bacterium]